MHYNYTAMAYRFLRVSTNSTQYATAYIELNHRYNKLHITNMLSAAFSHQLLPQKHNHRNQILTICFSWWKTLKINDKTCLNFRRTFEHASGKSHIRVFQKIKGCPVWMTSCATSNRSAKRSIMDWKCNWTSFTGYMLPLLLYVIVSMDLVRPTQSENNACDWTGR